MPLNAGRSEPGQRWDPERYARNARFVADLGAPVLELLAPAAGERILDLGCGDGALTAKIRDAGADVLGLDASAEQIAAAVRLGLDARVADAQRLELAPEFDAVFSNAALHWMTRPDDVIAGVWRALKPGGRFVGEMGGKGNVAAICNALHGALRRRGVDPAPFDPWYIPSDRDYSRKLEAAGFAVRSMALLPRPTPLPTALGDWLETFAEPFLRAVSGAERNALKREIEAETAPRLRRADGTWEADYVRLRFAAVKP